MLQPCKEIKLDHREDSKNLTINVTTQDSGRLLKIPVYLYNVSPCRKIIVGVKVYVNSKLYAIKVKKIFIPGYPFSKKIRSYFVGDFEFLLTDHCNDEIYFHITSHYTF